MIRREKLAKWVVEALGVEADRIDHWELLDYDRQLEATMKDGLVVRIVGHFKDVTACG